VLLRVLFSVVIVFVSFANSRDILSPVQKKILQNEKKQNEKSSDILEFDWVNPINLSYTHTKSDQTTPSQTSDIWSISLNQPIFRSGGIYYAVQYAKANREFLRLATSLKEKSLLKSAYVTLLNLKNIDLNIQKQKLLIENAKIDILRKKEQYLNGILDSSFLNNAILGKNRLEIGLLDMKSTKADLLKAFHALSSLDYKSVKLPHLKLVNLDKYIKNNILLKNSQANIKQLGFLKKMTVSNYFPTVSLFANYNKSRINYLGIKNDSYKSYGLSVSMPLFDINREKNIELQKLKVLKSKLELIDKKNSEKELYKSIVKKIEFYKKKIELAIEEEKLYKSLLKTTKDLYNAGEKTVYDVKTMQNSLNSTKLDKKIYKNDLDIELFKLYEHEGKM
jgi:outer membrane protein TolC